MSSSIDYFKSKLEKPVVNVDELLSRGNNNFNFLRLVLAAVVLFSHGFEIIYGTTPYRDPWMVLTHTLPLGEIAVDGFFLISGLLIVRSWKQDPNFWRYLKRRVLRIYPGFIAAFLVCLFVVAPIGAVTDNYLAQLNLKKLLLSLLFLQQPLTPPVFASMPGHPHINPSMWTISHEFRCYILAALAGVIILKKPKYWLIATVALLFIYPWRMSLASVHFPFSYYLTGNLKDLVRLAMFFMVGGCFLLFLEKIRFENKIAFLFLPLLIVFMCISRVSAELALATLGAYILFWFAFLKIPLIDRFKYQSDVSYGLYLYGWPVQRLLQWYFPIHSPWVLFPLAFVVSYACGYVSWKLIERPALQFKRDRPQDPRLINA